MEEMDTLCFKRYFLVILAIVLWPESKSIKDDEPPTPIANFYIGKPDFIYPAPGEIEISNTFQNGEFYKWNCGDGNTGSEGHTSRVYISNGDYIVTLITINGAGDCIETTEKLSIGAE